MRILRILNIKHTCYSRILASRSLYSRSLGGSELLQKVPGTRSHTLETLETTTTLIEKLL